MPISKKYNILILLAYAINFLMLITFEYLDVDSLTAWSLNIWDLIFGSGNLGDFYEYTELNLRGATYVNCAGNYLWLLPICIWNFPLWLFHVITGTMSVTNFYSICWMKLFFVVVLILCAIVVSKICYFYTSDKEKSIIAYILMLLSPEILISTGYAAQDEIVYICALVWAFYFYINEKYLKGYLLLLLAVTCCPIILIPAIILILVKQKQLAFVIGNVIGLLIPSFAFEFIYRNDEIFQYMKTRHGMSVLGTSMLNGLTVSLPEGEVSIAIGILIVLFFLAYMTEDIENNKERVLGLVTLSMVTICFFMSVSFYRLFLYVPFLLILVLKTGENMNINLFLLTIVAYCRCFHELTSYYPQTMNMYNIMKNSWITDLHDKYGLYDYLNFDRGGLGKYFLEGDYISLLNTVSATCTYVGIRLLLFINFSVLKNEMSTKKKKIYELKLSYTVSLWVYCACVPLMMVAFFKMLF